MADIKIKDLYTLDETIAKEFLERFEYPWEALPHIKEFIIELGNTLNPDEYEKRGDDVWVAKSAKVFDSAYIGGPCIIGKDGHCGRRRCRRKFDGT